MARKKENAVVLSQEMIARGYLQHVDQDGRGRGSGAGTVYFHVYERREQAAPAPDQYL